MDHSVKTKQEILLSLSEEDITILRVVSYLEPSDKAVYNHITDYILEKDKDNIYLQKTEDQEYPKKFDEVDYSVVARLNKLYKLGLLHKHKPHKKSAYRWKQSELCKELIPIF